jgi:sortase A
MTRPVGLLIGFVLFLGTSACAGLIKIELVPTPTPVPARPSPAPTSMEPTTPSGEPVRIISEAIGLDAPVVEMGWRTEQQWGQVVSEWVVPENEAGWHVNSAHPGEGGNIVISGHNNSAGGRVFRNLEELEVGNRVTLVTDDGESYDYQISDKEIVRAFGASSETLNYLHQIMQPTETERLTLISCWPSWTNTHRLIIIATPL